MVISPDHGATAVSLPVISVLRLRRSLCPPVRFGRSLETGRPLSDTSRHIPPFGGGGNGHRLRDIRPGIAAGGTRRWLTRPVPRGGRCGAPGRRRRARPVHRRPSRPQGQPPARSAVHRRGARRRDGGTVRTHLHQRPARLLGHHDQAAGGQRLAADPAVAYVEQDRAVRRVDTQTSPPSWGLDRIDQARPAARPELLHVRRPRRADVTAYVIDTGIRITHEEFGGRAATATTPSTTTRTPTTATATARTSPAPSAAPTTASPRTSSSSRCGCSTATG